MATGPPPSFFERSNEEQKSFLSRLIISIIKSSVNCSNNEVQVFLPISMKLVKPLIRSLIESFSIQSIEHLKIMNIIPVGMFVLLSLSVHFDRCLVIRLFSSIRKIKSGRRPMPIKFFSFVILLVMLSIRSMDSWRKIAMSYRMISNVCYLVVLILSYQTCGPRRRRRKDEY